MFTIEKDVSGKFVAIDRNKDINEFCTGFRISLPGFDGLKFVGQNNIGIFSFDPNIVSETTAQNELTIALDNFLTTSINILKREVCDTINELRDEKLYSYFPYDGYRWDCDNVSRANIIGTVTFAMMVGGTLPPEAVWKCYDDNIHSVTFQYMASMSAALLQYTQTVYGASWLHKGNINSLSSPTDIVNYDFSAGWPTQEP